MANNPIDLLTTSFGERPILGLGLLLSYRVQTRIEFNVPSNSCIFLLPYGSSPDVSPFSTGFLKHNTLRCALIFIICVRTKCALILSYIFLSVVRLPHRMTAIVSLIE